MYDVRRKHLMMKSAYCFIYRNCKKWGKDVVCDNRIHLGFIWKQP